MAGWTLYDINGVVRGHANSGDLTYNGRLCGKVPSECNDFIQDGWEIELDPFEIAMDVKKSSNFVSCNRESLVMWFEHGEGSFQVMTPKLDLNCQIKNVDDCKRIIEKSDSVMNSNTRSYTFNIVETFSTNNYTDNGHPCVLIDPTIGSGCKYLNNHTYNNMHKISYYLSGATSGVTMGQGYYPDNEVFTGLTQLKEIYFPHTTSQSKEHVVTRIGHSAFKNMASLTGVTLGSVVNVGPEAFRGCTNLTTVDFGYKHCNHHPLKYIDTKAFSDCTSLVKIDLSNDMPPNGVDRIGDAAFSGCTSLTTVLLPTNNTYTTISVMVFDACSQLSTITIPSGIMNIKEHAFRGCTNLESVIINGLKKQNSQVHATSFENCPSIANVTISEDTDLTRANGCFFSGNNMGGGQIRPNLDVRILGTNVNQTLDGAFDSGDTITFTLNENETVDRYREKYPTSTYPNWTFTT